MNQRIKRLESPCGFGTCSGHIDCSDRQCPEHPCKTGMLGLPVLNTMTDDRFNLHRVETSRMPYGACVNEGACQSDLPIQYADEPKDYRTFALWCGGSAAIVIGVIAAIAYAST